LAVLRHKADLVDQRADYLERLVSRAVVAQRLVQVLDALPVNLGEAGVDRPAWFVGDAIVLRGVESPNTTATLLRRRRWRLINSPPAWIRETSCSVRRLQPFSAR
jgi:hypothetical protein